jgi:hypothetical protein
MATGFDGNEYTASLLNRCNPRLIQVDESCGCTLTKANIVAMDSARFEAQGLLQVGADKLIAQTKELRMTGVKEKPLIDLVLSRLSPGSMSVIGGNQYQQVVAPFSLVPQRSVVNTNYWEVVSGEKPYGYGSGSIPASAWTITVAVPGSPWSSPLEKLENYFLPGKYLAIMTADEYTSVGRTLVFKILSAANADSGDTKQAKVVLEPNISAAGWTALTNEQKMVYYVRKGIAINLANSVSNYESWCAQYPAENTRKLRDFWWQRIRSTWCYNDAYVEALNAPLTSEYFKKFRMLPLAEQRKRQGEQEERDWLNTIFYGQRINEHQTDTTYRSLPEVVDPANDNCVLEYKANTLGIATQLAECGRVLDLQNAPLDLDVVKEMLYQIRRTRNLSGIADVDAMGDRFTMAAFRHVFRKYLKEYYGVDAITDFYKPGEKIMFGGQVLWGYDRFELAEDGVAINMIHDDYFDDQLAAFPAAYKHRGRQLWFVDWSDINVAVTDVRSVNRKTNEADDLYNCVIQPLITHYQLQSKAIQVQIQDPNRHLIVGNYSSYCPTLTGSVCTDAPS